MDGAKDEVSGFGGADGGFEGFLIAHFADEYDIGVFTDECAEGIVEIDAIDTDLTLVDECFGILEDVFDGIFDGDDMNGFSLVDVLEHGRNGG